MAYKALVNLEKLSNETSKLTKNNIMDNEKKEPLAFML